jgi:cobalt/nickel transport system permease protein
MHISDGIISTGISLSANVVSIGLIYISGKKTPLDDIPKMGMMGAALFVASLIHFPLAGTSVHLGLYGIAGIILGKRAFPAVFAAILFQSLVFQHGGLLAVGINSLNMGAGAFAAWLVWNVKTLPEAFRSVMAGISGIIVPVLLMSLVFHLSGYGTGIFYLFSVYLVVAGIEGALSFFVVRFVRSVKTELLT